MWEIKSINEGTRVRAYFAELGSIAAKGFAIGFGVGIPALLLAVCWQQLISDDIPDLIWVALIIAAAKDRTLEAWNTRAALDKGEG